jgi:hypothetical protein
MTMTKQELIDKLKAMISKPTDEFDRGYNAAVKRIIRMIEAEEISEAQPPQQDTTP